MLQKRPVSILGKIILGSIIGLFTGIIIINSFTSEFNLRYLVRLSALIGLTSAMISVILSNAPERISSIFGKNFLKMHHFFAIIGIILITLHPISFAIEMLNIGVFIPDFSSWDAFWRLAGRPALYLFYVGIVAGLLRRQIKNSWRIFHMILYLAIFFAIVHATLIGKNFENPIILIIFYVLFGVVVLTPFYKRFRVKFLRKTRTQHNGLK